MSILSEISCGHVQEVGEHAHCGRGILPQSGFSYNPEAFMAADIGVYNFSWRDMGVPTLFKMMDIVQVKRSLLLNCTCKARLWSLHAVYHSSHTCCCKARSNLRSLVPDSKAEQYCPCIFVFSAVYPFSLAPVHYYCLCPEGSLQLGRGLLQRLSPMFRSIVRPASCITSCTTLSGKPLDWREGNCAMSSTMPYHEP